MGLAETATLLVDLVLKDDMSATATKATTALGNAQTKTGAFNTALSGLGKTALSLGGAAGFGALAAGALQAQDAQGKFMAETGQSRQAAKDFVSQMDSLAGSAGTVNMNFEDVAKTGTAVATQFGLTGAAGRDMTEKFAEFAKVTGQDATGAVNDFDALLDAFKLPASAATGLMDQLVASHQKFGTEAGPAAVDALTKMAPALQGLNLNLDDGVGLLNLFEDNGLNADAAMRGLQTAVKNLKPGQTFDDLITQVSNIEDPTLRAQKAMELFGTKAGSGLALALKPGVTSLDQWKISQKDAAGASTQAANDMLTDADKIKSVAEKITAGAREIGQDFGPALTGLASLGSLAAPLAGNMKDMLVKVGEQVIPAATAEGTLVGGAVSAGIALGIVTVGATVIAAAEIQAIQDAKNKVNSNPQSIDGPDLFDARAPMWARAKVSAAQQMQALGQDSLNAFNQAWDAGIASGMGPNDPALLASARAAGLAVSDVFTHDSVSSFQAAGQKVAATVFDHDSFVTAGATAAHISVQNFGDVFDHDSRSVLVPGSTQAAHEVANALADKQIWDSSARSITSNLAQTLRSGKDNIAGAMDDLTWAIKHPLQLAKQQAEIEGQLTSDKLKNALASNNPEIRTQAQQTQQYLIGLWQQLTGKAYNEGSTTSDNLRDSISSDYGQIKGQARAFVGDLNDIFAGLKTHYNIGVSETNTSRIGKNDGGHRAGGGSVAAGYWYRVNEQGEEFFMSEHGGTILPHTSVEQMQRGQGFNVPPPIVNVQITAREATSTVGHYGVLQGQRSGAF